MVCAAASWRVQRQWTETILVDALNSHIRIRQAFRQRYMAELHSSNFHCASGASPGSFTVTSADVAAATNTRFLQAPLDSARVVAAGCGARSSMPRTAAMANGQKVACLAQKIKEDGFDADLAVGPGRTWSKVPQDRLRAAPRGLCVRQSEPSLRPCLSCSWDARQLLQNIFQVLKRRNFFGRRA